ncbi:nicotinamide N-methyltransferase-like [Spea bombifrons]|uniref:nicotinamide N-methyltransferase-like n=1 Tax=Spea bombifrons TaxID=233779 RepID=UPI00234AD3E9|nr:nicotinamide N-methyltransferase-like [Spea bombifrons]
MASTPSKYYHVHEFDPIHLLDIYCSPNIDEALLEDMIIDPMEYLYKVSGLIKGDMLIDITIGPVICHLLPICEFFKEITVLEFNDLCISELEKWIKGHDEAYDWSHASKFVTDLEGKSGWWQEKETMLKRKMNRIVKCDLSKDNPTDPLVLPKADCVISGYLLEVTSKDKNEYMSNLRKISSLLKPGGRLILLAAINMSYYKIGEHKYASLSYDEEFLKVALKSEGYTIESYETKVRKTLTDFDDHKKAVFLIALKQKES